MRMMIAGGGTGGHLFPGMAVAEEFMGRGPENRVLFVGTAAGIEARKVPEAGYEFAAIRSRGLAGMGLMAKLKGVAVLPLSILDAIGVVRKFRPQVALGVGGYVSGPAILAAKLQGVPAALQEQNTVPGFANRILGRFVDRVFLSFESSRSWFARAEKKGRVTVTGNPVRRKIVQALSAGESGANKAGADKTGAGEGTRTPSVSNEGGASGAREKVKIFIVGGSQGAHGLNVLMLEAMARLSAEDRARLIVRHQTGDKDRESAAGRYRELGMAATVESFIQDMAPAYLEADLMVSRSGAGAVAEIALAGKPAIFIPFPFAASDHQAKNAEELVKSGAALMKRESESDGAVLAELISSLIRDPEKRRGMAAKARALSRPRAAAEIVDQCLKMV